MFLSKRIFQKLYIIKILFLLLLYPLNNAICSIKKDIKYLKRTIKNEKLKKAFDNLINEKPIKEEDKNEILLLALQQKSFQEENQYKKSSVLFLNFLNKNGFDLNRKIHYYNFIHWAIFMNNIEVVKFLLKKNIILRDNFLNRTPLHWAAASGNLEIMKILIKSFKNLNSKTEYLGKTPLHIACEMNRYRIAKFLLQNGAKTNIKDSNSRLAIDLAVESKNIKLVSLVVKYMLEHKKKSHQIVIDDSIRLRLLENAIRKKNPEIFAEILKAFGYSYSKIKIPESFDEVLEFSIIEFAIKFKNTKII